MRPLALLPFLIAELVSGATCPSMRPFRNAALLVGISSAWLQEGPRPLRFAGADADRLQPLFEQQFGAENVFKLTNSGATTANVSACLDGLVRFAQPGGKVVIFISARGFSSSQMDDGYVLTSDAAIDKLPRTGGQVGNGISMQTLRRKLAAMQAKDKYLLLDLCRDPAETPAFDNLINNRVLDRKFLDSATRQIVLSSAGSRRSLESVELKNGYYAGSLAETLAPNPRLELQKLFEELKTKVRIKSQTKQTPDRPPAAPNDGWQDCLLCRLSLVRTRPLLASLFPSTLVADALAAFSAQEPPDVAEAVSNEESAQRIFARYGEGNHFPGDPFHECGNARPEFRNFRLCREEYEAAAVQFDRAAALRRTIPAADPDGNRALIESLEERARFCRAQADLLTNNAASVPNELGDPVRFQFAESHNILGLAYLEMAKYPEAEAQFELAIRKAPHWAYPRHNLALAWTEHGNYSAAENEYREAIRWTPVGVKIASDKDDPCFHGRTVTVSERPYLYYNLGVLLQRLNRLGEAQRDFCLAEESFRLWLDPVNSLGAESDADQTALADLRSKAARINLADVNNSLGVLFEARNKSTLAAARFEEALNNNPELSSASFNLARLYAAKALARGDTATARERYQDVLDKSFCRIARPDLGCQAALSALQRLPVVAK